MQKHLADSFIAENVAVYDYSGKDDRFYPKNIFDFIEANNMKEVFFVLNFQIPFLGKEPDPEQPDYFALNLCRDVLNDYNKKIFFFTTQEIEYNISITALDFYDYCLLKIVFEDGTQHETKKTIENLGEDFDSLNQKTEIERRLTLYKDKIEEFLNIDAKTLTPIDKKSKYLLVAARDLSYFAGLYEKTGAFVKALELYNKALGISEKVQGVEHLNTAAIYNNIGRVYHHQGDYSKSLDYHQKALKIWKKVLGDEHPDVATSYNNIGCAYYAKGENYKSLEYHQKALKIREKVLGHEHPKVALSYNNKGSVYFSQGDYSKALQCYQKALMIWKKVLGDEHPDIAILYSNVGDVYDSQGDYSKALEYLQKALKIREKTLGENHPATMIACKAIDEIKKKV